MAVPGKTKGWTDDWRTEETDVLHHISWPWWIHNSPSVLRHLLFVLLFVPASPVIRSWTPSCLVPHISLAVFLLELFYCIPDFSCSFERRVFPHCLRVCACVIKMCLFFAGACITALSCRTRLCMCVCVCVLAGRRPCICQRLMLTQPISAMCLPQEADAPASPPVRAVNVEKWRVCLNAYTTYAWLWKLQRGERAHARTQCSRL